MALRCGWCSRWRRVLVVVWRGQAVPWRRVQTLLRRCCLLAYTLQTGVGCRYALSLATAGDARRRRGEQTRGEGRNARCRTRAAHATRV